MKRITTFSLACLVLANFASAQGGDTCATAQDVMSMTSFPYDNTLATSSGDGGICTNVPPNGTGNFYQDVWFVWTAPASADYSVTQTGIDGVLGVFDGDDCTNSVLSACVDTFGVSDNVVLVGAVAGNSYLIVVGGWDVGLVGTGTVDIVALAPPSTGVCTNGGFESGNLAGWTATDIAFPFAPLQATAAFANGFGLFNPVATEGSFFAFHGFDGAGPGQILLSQDVVLPGNTTNLTFDWQAGWDMQSFVGGNTGTRTFDLVIRPTGGGAALQSTNLLMAMAGTMVLDNGLINESVDISAFAGMAVQISFEWTIPDANSGPGAFMLDNVLCAPASPASNFCTVNDNSTGAPAIMSTGGSNSIADGALTLSASPVPNDNYVFYSGPLQIQTPFGQGFRCVGGSVIRHWPPALASGNMASLTFDPAFYGMAPGTWNAQCWFRDPMGGGMGFNLSDGIEYDLVP